jgi:predicted GNAT family acetyltransferase
MDGVDSVEPMNEVVHSPESERYEIRIDGRVAGYTGAEDRDGVVVMPHTEVDEEFEGQGVASELVAGALDDIRRRGLKIVVECPYIKQFIEDHQEYADLVT